MVVYCCFRCRRILRALRSALVMDMSLLPTYLYNLFNAKTAPKIQDEPISHNSDSSSAEQPIEIKGDQFTNQEATQLLNLKSTDLWALGLTTAIGGHYFAWNAGLTAGFGSFLIALFLIFTAYFTVVLCIAELSSALPFAGKKSTNFFSPLFCCYHK